MIFKTTQSDLEKYNGMECTVLGELPEGEYDKDEVGTMYNIRLSDGTELQAFEDEVIIPSDEVVGKSYEIASKQYEFAAKFKVNGESEEKALSKLNMVLEAGMKATGFEVEVNPIPLEDEDDHKTYTETVLVDKSVEERLQELLDLEEVDFEKESIEPDSRLQCFSVKFDNGLMADIRVFAGQHNCYVDPVLFDESGCELDCAEASDVLLGEYHFSFNCDDYVVIVE